MFSFKPKQRWTLSLLALGMSWALLPMVSEARVIPDTFHATGYNTGGSNITLGSQQDTTVSVKFNLDVTLQYQGAFTEVGNSCNEFWDVGVQQIQMVGHIENTSCPNTGCKLTVSNVPGNIMGMVDDGNGGLTSTIPNNYSGPVYFDMMQVLKDTGPNSTSRQFDITLQSGGNSSVTLSLNDGTKNVVDIKVTNEPLGDTFDDAGIDASKIIPVQVDATGLGNGEALQPGDATNIEISTIQVAYTGTGNPADVPNFLLVSGVPGSKYMYRNMINELAKIGNVVAYDRPGLGDSEKVTNTRVYGYSLQNEADLIDKLVTQLNLDKNLIVIANENGTLGAEAYVRTHYSKNDPNNFVKGLVVTEPWVDACKDENNVTWDSDFTKAKNGPAYYFKTDYDPATYQPGDNINLLLGPDGRPQLVQNPVGKGLCTRGFVVPFWGDEFGGVYSYDAFKKTVDALPANQKNNKTIVGNIAKQFSILSTWAFAFHDSPYNDFERTRYFDALGNPLGDMRACLIFTGAFGVYYNDPSDFAYGGDNFGGITLLIRNQGNNDTVLHNSLKYISLEPANQAFAVSELPALGNPFAFPLNPFMRASCFAGDFSSGNPIPFTDIFPALNPLTRYPRTIPFPKNPDTVCQADGTSCPVPASNQMLADNNAASMAAGDPSGDLYGLPRLMLLGDTPPGGGTFIWHPSQVDYARNTLHWTVQCVGQGGHELPEDAPINMLKRIKQWGAANGLF